MITLIGHGYIGKQIKKELEHQNIHHEWITHAQSVPAGTTVIINAAGYTGSPNVDACEQYKQETIDGNVVFPLQLESANPSTPIVHITSGCVYTGYKPGGWTEEDAPNFNFNNGSFCLPILSNRNCSSNNPLDLFFIYFLLFLKKQNLQIIS